MWQEVCDKSKWNDSVGKQKPARFLQSWAWGEFQQSLGRKVLRFSWADKIFAQAVKMNLPGGLAYWYIPRGSLDSASFSELKKMLGEHGALFLRVDPITALSPQNKIKEISSVQPQCTLILDLSQSEEKILSQMHPKTRYNNNLAQKKGVSVGAGSIEDFIKLNQATTKRDKFASHPDWYYRKMAHILNPLLGDLPAEAPARPAGGLAKAGAYVRVWQASYEKQVVSSAIVMYFGDAATYMHGASANEFRNVMAPYFLHWEIIKNARKQGFNFYDWWGVNPEDINHPAYKKSWEGITRFKMGFGGEVICNPPSFDLIYRPMWYRLYKLLRKLPRITNTLRIYK